MNVKIDYTEWSRDSLGIASSVTTTRTKEWKECTKEEKKWWFKKLGKNVWNGVVFGSKVIIGGTIATLLGKAIWNAATMDKKQVVYVYDNDEVNTDDIPVEETTEAQ